MTKAGLIFVITEKSGLSKTEASKALSAIVESIADALKAGNQVTITGFGRFGVTVRSARAGKNPQTGAALTIASSKSVKFKAGQRLKDAVNLTH